MMNAKTKNSDVRRLAGLSLTLLACSVGLAACDDSPTDDGETLTWEAELTGAEVEGIATVLSNGTAFEAAIEIANAPEDATYVWHIAAGTCEEPGDAIGAANLYPDLEVAQDGTAEAEAEVTGALDEEEDYIALVLDDSGDEPVVVSCGELVPGE